MRGISLTYGQTTIDGGFIRTGEISSLDNATKFNLNTGYISGRITFAAGSSGYANISDKPALGSLSGLNIVELAQLGTTVITGGYLATSLIDANYIRTIDLIATKVTSGLLQSVNTLNYFDLDNNKFKVGNATNYMDWNVTTPNVLTIKGHVTADSGTISGVTINANDQFSLNGSKVEIFPNAGIRVFGGGYADFTNSTLKVPTVAASGLASGEAALWIGSLSGVASGASGGSVATLSDVALTGLATGQILVWNGATWVNQNNVAAVDLSAYYTKTETQNFFSGASAMSGYNKSNWDSAYAYSTTPRLALTGGTLTGPLAGTSATFGGTLTVQGAGSGAITFYHNYSGSPGSPGFVITDYYGTVSMSHNANGGGTGISGTLSLGGNITAPGGTIGRVRTDGINRGSYGSISVSGSASGYGGIDFTDSGMTLMMNPDVVGVLKNNTTWLYYWNGSGVLTEGTVPVARITGLANSATISATTSADASTIVLRDTSGRLKTADLIWFSSDRHIQMVEGSGWYFSNPGTGVNGYLGSNAFSSTAYLPLSGGTLTGALYGTSASFSGNGTFSGGYIYGQTTNSFIRLDNSIGSQIGYAGFGALVLDSNGVTLSNANSAAITLNYSAYPTNVYGGGYKNLIAGAFTLMYRNDYDFYLGSNSQYNGAGTYMSIYGTAEGAGMLTFIGGKISWLTYDGTAVAGTAQALTEKFSVTKSGAGYFANGVSVSGDSGFHAGSYGSYLRRSISASHGSWEMGGYNKGAYNGLNIIDNSGYYNNFMFASGQGGWYRENDAGGAVWVMYWNQSHRCLGIGGATTEGGYAAYVNGGLKSSGSINASGTGYFGGDVIAYYSDIRLKNIKGRIANALHKLHQVDGVHYEANDHAISIGAVTVKKNEVGLIAQQWQPIMPEVLALAPFDMDGEGRSKSGMNYMTMKYERTVPLIIEAVKEMDNKYEREIAELKSRIMQLERRIN